MPAAAPLTTALPNVDADPASLRIVLFGMPDAGKSSLLGALVQAAHMQDRILQGRLLDLSNGMAELWRRVYEDRQRETLEEIVPYPVYFEPYAGDPDATPKLGAILYDCDGRVANELLSQRQGLQKKDAKAGSLAHALADADAIILTVDASASNEQVETDFREFVRFLQVLQTHRSRDHAVGGLPVFLALTKCDRLVRETITKAEWERRIALRQMQVQERFGQYLAGAPLTFGSVELRIAPTAVKQPELTDAPAQPRAPYGVAELFHDCLRSAHHFRQRCLGSNRRLKWIAGGAAGFLATAAAIAFILIRSGGPVEKPLGLAERVAQFEARDKPLPDRLAAAAIQRRATELAELRENPDFDKLPDERRNFVRGRLDELQAYLKLGEQLAELPSPEKARNLPELDRIKEKLENQAPLPAKYQSAWEQAPPPFVVERNRRLQACQAIHDGVDELRRFDTELKNKANDRLFDADFHLGWDEQVSAILAKEAMPPFTRADEVKGTAYDFDEITPVEKEWLAVRKKLQDLRDLALALSLTSNQPGQEAVLVIPAFPSDENMNSFCAARLASLKKLYPGWKSWSLAAIPDALQAEVRKKLKRSYDQMIRDGQRMILDKLREGRPTGDDVPSDWQPIATWLMSPGLRDWRELLGDVARLLDPAGEGPAPAAASFLRQESFDMRPRALTVSIPKNLPQGMLLPGNTMQVYVRPRGANAARATLTFRIAKGATVEGTREKKYRFEAVGLGDDESRLVYNPGDDFGAELPLLKGGKNWEFIWSNGATASFAFDCLSREPYLRPAGATERGSRADGVTVTVDGRFPTIPALLPDVRPERK